MADQPAYPAPFQPIPPHPLGPDVGFAPAVELGDWTEANGTFGAEIPEIVWYMANNLSDDERLRLAHATGGAVLRGEAGRKAGGRMRQHGYRGRLWLDPAVYERPDENRPETLFGDYWLVAQQELEVVEFISPGTLVDAGDFDGLARAVSAERDWAEQAGGRASLALSPYWLIDGLATLIARLKHAEVPIALAFVHPKDPLALAGAVSGLVQVLKVVPDMAISRSDIGTFGAAAHGAVLSSVGTSASVRHVVPPGRGGGFARDSSPNVFVLELLDFKLGSWLDQLPLEASPRCEMPCCEGQELRRFNDERWRGAALEHNMMAIGYVRKKILSAARGIRPNLFASMCQDAIAEAQRLSAAARRRFPARPQINAWARMAAALRPAADRPAP